MGDVDDRHRQVRLGHRPDLNIEVNSGNVGRSWFDRYFSSGHCNRAAPADEVLRMASDPTVQARHDPANRITTVILAGDLDEAPSGTLGALWSEILAPRQRIELDMSGVTFLNSAGIAALVDGHQQALAVDGVVTITSASNIVRRVLEITGLSHLVSPSG